jgi:hypothetical protein
MKIYENLGSFQYFWLIVAQQRFLVPPYGRKENTMICSP